ncbi:MAG: hypothetical protein IJT91_02465, partial [Clostridia bacterium]|nr:hypothetical protein [Clostridia bacterium]
MKKILSIFLTLLMLSMTVLASIPVGAREYKGGNLDFSMTNAAGNPNDEITIQLNLNENPGFYAFWFM